MGPDIAKPPVTWRAMRTRYPHLSPANRVQALPEHRVVYVRNAKAACSTVLLWLDRIYTGEHDFSPGNVHTENRLPRPREVGTRRIGQLLSGEAYRFTFVRDPLRRFVSVYRDKIEKPKRWRTEIQELLGQEPDITRSVSIEDFISAIERQDPLTAMDPHWRPQHINVMTDLVDYDHIGRIETFADDLEHIRVAAGLPLVPVEARNVARRAPDDLLASRPDLEERVRALYARDYELFGY